MAFNRLTSEDLSHLQTILPADRFSTGESNLDLHASDQSRHEACRPEAVLWPVDKEEVSKILSYAEARSIPVTAWGAGSSLEGNPIPVRGGIVLDFSRMNRILKVREEDFQADVEPGVVYQDLNERLRLQGLFFPPDPGARATLGGMIANNASGSRTVRYGATKDYVMRLSVVLANGELVELGTRASKSSSGYDLLHLFVGSEGTLGIVVEATVKLAGYPSAFSAAVADFPTVELAGKAVFEIMKAGLAPAALEFLSPECIEAINEERGLALNPLPTLFMEFAGPSETHLAEVMGTAEELCVEKGCDGFRMGIGRKERDDLLKARHELGEMIIRRHPDRTVMTTDAAVPITRFPELIAFAQEMMETVDIPGYIFSHAGDGNIHLVLMGRRGDAAEWRVIDALNRRLVLKALELGGASTGEHGVGIGKRVFMREEHGSALEWMKRLKDLFDPKGILNPGKIFPQPMPPDRP